MTLNMNDQVGVTADDGGALPPLKMTGWRVDAQLLVTTIHKQVKP